MSSRRQLRSNRPLSPPAPAATVLLPPPPAPQARSQPWPTGFRGTRCTTPWAGSAAARTTSPSSAGRGLGQSRIATAGTVVGPAGLVPPPLQDCPAPPPRVEQGAPTVSGLPAGAGRVPYPPTSPPPPQCDVGRGCRRACDGRGPPMHLQRWTVVSGKGSHISSLDGHWGARHATSVRQGSWFSQ